mmetsp:Transcript_63474/g.127463  ORF Transcript_63474/g.127463 Transcript_63474/m.127463 type:complete len:148 (-) Transcript_63474:235-678(-)
MLKLSLCRDQDLIFTAENFTTSVVESKTVFVVEYYSKMCGSCKEFEPIWSRVASSIESEYGIGRVNIDSKEGMKLAKQQGILKLGIPAVQVVAGSHSSVVMAGKSLSQAELQKSISQTAQRYKSTKHPDTGLYVHSDFFSENKLGEF